MQNSETFLWDTLVVNSPGGRALQYEMDIHVGVRLRLPNPGAYGESEEKKVGALGESRSKYINEPK